MGEFCFAAVPWACDQTPGPWSFRAKQARIPVITREVEMLHSTDHGAQPAAQVSNHDAVNARPTVEAAQPDFEESPDNGCTRCIFDLAMDRYRQALRRTARTPSQGDAEQRMIGHQFCSGDRAARPRPRRSGCCRSVQQPTSHCGHKRTVTHAEPETSITVPLRNLPDGQFVLIGPTGHWIFSANFSDASYICL